MIRAHAQFGKSDRERLTEWQRHQRQLMRAREETDKRRKMEADDAAEADLISVVATIASDDQIEAFTVQLDEFDGRLNDYHEASVDALIEANEALDAVTERLKQVRRDLSTMRESAFKLEDGRQIFLSEDGTRAIDTNGDDVAIDTVPVDEVPPSAWIAERYEGQLDHLNALTAEEAAITSRIDAIHDFDSKRAEAAERSGEIRSRIEEGDVTTDELKAFEDELKAMDEELAAAMPPSVRMRVDGASLEAGQPGQKPASAESAADIAPAEVSQTVVRSVAPEAFSP